jgi:hypothetical protein
MSIPRLAALALVVSLAAPPPALAAAPYSAPGPGSLQRRALLDAIRPEVERRFGRPIEFVVEHMRVGGGYAFVAVTPQRRGGAGIRNPDEEADGVHTEAVLRYVGGRWTVVEQNTGSTDVWYLIHCGRIPDGLIPGGC